MSATPGYVYLMRSNGLHKIGVARDVEKRRRQIEHASGRPVDLVACVHVVDRRFVERQLHGLFAGHRKIGEWFDLPGSIVEQIANWMNERNPS